MLKTEKHVTEAAASVAALFSEWNEQPQKFAIARDGELGKAIDGMVLLANDSESLSDVLVAARRVGVEWQDYLDGECRPRTGEPMPKFFRAVSNLMEKLQQEARSERLSAAQQSPEIVPIATLRAQGLNVNQIARIYGAFDEDNDVLVGPFYDADGNVLLSEIEREEREPGSVLKPGWQHPSVVFEQQRQEREHASNMRKAQRREDVSKSEEARKIKPKPDRETVLRLLAEKLFPSQIQLDYDITIEEVDAIAKKAGIAVQTAETYQREPEPEREDSTPAVEGNEKAEAQSLKDLVTAEMQADASATSQQIAERLSAALGQPVKPASVNAIMTNIKRRQNQASA